MFFVNFGYSLGFSATYINTEYKEHPIRDEFKNILTIENIKENLETLIGKISSPTACYFDFQKYIDSEIFYRDYKIVLFGLWIKKEEFILF